MASQIFKKKIPTQMLFELLEKIAVITDKRFILSKAAYKKGNSESNNTIQEFLNQCKEYYYLSKQKYLEKKLNYNSFITVVRQICNYNNITYTSQIKYSKSDYDIEYYIYKE